MNDERRPEDAAATTLTYAADHSAGGGDRLLTAQELGAYLGLAAGTILDRFERGDLPGYRLFGRKGGPVRFRSRDVERFLEGCRVEARAS